MAVTVTNVPTTRRIERRPKHHFHIRQRPWQLQPIMIAPVLANETLERLTWQARTVSKPIKNPLIGWWHESYFFYIKLRDLERASVDEQAITNMLIDPTYDIVTALGAAAADAKHYHHSGTINWSARCLEAVVDHYFRNEGEDPSAAGFHIDAVQLASVGTEESWLQSMEAATDVETDSPNIPVVGGTHVEASDVETQMLQWALLKKQNMTEMTFEDYLASFGVRPRASEMGKPELIRFNRTWSYPTNTVEPTTGVPSSALSFSIQERADKARLFKEPGFIYGIQCLRPKVYRKNQSGSLVDSLTNAIRWLPATLMHDTESSIVKIDNALTGPITGQTNDYMLDLKDLFVRGDQFVNHAVADTDYNGVALPAADAKARYASSADADAMFAAAAPANTIETDGIVQLTIKGMQRDTTP